MAESDSPAQQQWAGVWAGAWGGVLKHILLVESIAEEGAARVVYAVGDPFRKWSRYTAAIAERDLKIADVPFSATYEMTREGALKGKWALRDAPVRSPWRRRILPR